MDRLVRLGTFDLDLTTGELSRGGRRVHLSGQAVKVLCLLVEHAPDAVARDTIRASLWNGDTHVEFDIAINTCISQIRTALGDSARSPRFIETVPRLGYRCLVLPQRAPVNRASLIATAALATLIVALVPLSIDRAPASRSIVALQKYERGISGLADAGPDELIARVRHFETAIGADPQFAAAYAGLAEAKLLLGTYRREPPAIAYAAAKAAGQRAIELDPRLANGHATFGAAALHFEWDWAVANRHLARAVALDSRSLTVQLWRSRYLTAAGDHQRAIAAARRGVTLAPGSPAAHTTLGIAYFYARQFDQSRTACAEAAALMREFTPAKTCLAAADLTTSRSPHPVLGPVVQFVHAGDRERAVEWLQAAANRHSDTLIFAAVEPGFDPIRDDPRFTSVLRRIGWPRPPAGR